MIYRIDVRLASLARGGPAAVDPVGESIRQQIRELGAETGPITTSRIFLLDTDAPREQVEPQAVGERPGEVRVVLRGQPIDELRTRAGLLLPCPRGPGWVIQTAALVSKSTARDELPLTLNSSPR